MEDKIPDPRSCSPAQECCSCIQCKNIPIGPDFLEVGGQIPTVAEEVPRSMAVAEVALRSMAVVEVVQNHTLDQVEVAQNHILA